MDVLKQKTIVLGVTGSIAAYKAADLTSKLVQAGALVDVVLTKEAAAFVTPLTFRSLTHRPAAVDLFDPNSEQAIEHVALAQRADAVLVAPATANAIARFANGLADDLLACIVLATTAPLLIAPAMEHHMFQHPATQANLDTLRRRGATVIGPASGRLASGEVGWGRMLEVPELIGHLRAVLGRNGDLAGRRIVVSAGGTQEPLDPVRVLTNRSTGKQGYALAEAARDRGASVVLITAPTALPDPVAMSVVHCDTALQMFDAVTNAVQGCDAIIMAAAVADYRPTEAFDQKIKKEQSPELMLSLVKNPDIIASTNGPFIKVAFAAESEDLILHARDKLVRKNVDLVIANDISATDAGFAVDTNRVVILHRDGSMEDRPLMLKSEVADEVLDRVVALLNKVG
ncbi:MAG TPA: bifunctional phosphopantothenoylcysteine decarboxylase/phosphopantothenate--cysteine ligase CoaBC [Dehalococcoidia bacterium]|nr:bifunctional phosphopantothenoylcysteine decarboxylase/phosphopantothenate--cysteine ligase CoaBC [Dehalococcoidia bacterium]